MLGDERDVLAPLAQRRQVDRNDVDPIEQVFAKTAVGNPLRQILVGRRDHPDVGFHFLEAADAPEFPLLEHAQELHLHHAAHLPDLVQEYRPALRDLDEPLLVRLGAGEGAAHVAKQLRFQQRLGQRPAVDGHERLFAAQ